MDRRFESFVPLALGVIPVDVLSTRPCHGNKHEHGGLARESTKQREQKAWWGHNRVVALRCYALDKELRTPRGEDLPLPHTRTTATRFQRKMAQVQTTQVVTTQMQAQTQVQAHLAVVNACKLRHRRCRRRGLSGNGVSRFTEFRSSLEFSKSPRGLRAHKTRLVFHIHFTCRRQEGNHDVLLRPFMMTTTAIFRKNNTLVPDKQVLRFLVPDKQVRTTESSILSVVYAICRIPQF